MHDPHRTTRGWLVVVLGFILVMVAVGGITRLTESGLSMVTWEPILGVLPPLNAAQWQERFDQYRAFPEYQQLNKGMSLDAFKRIFFWEYLHRLLGRLLGLVYAVPLVVLWRRGRFDRALKIKLAAGLALGGAQGFMGWYMVASGLVENPFVSHYRLAAHLGLAFFLFGYLLWVWDGLRPDRPQSSGPASAKTRAWVAGLVALLVVQIVWGAFVAGLNAGYFYNTFPTMQGYWLPPHGGQLEPFIRNLVDNPSMVQFIHRTLGMLLLALTVAAWASLARDPTVDAPRRRMFHGFAGLILVQFWLGVFTLVLVVPISLATLHQVTACLLTGVAALMLVRFFQVAEEAR